MKLLTVEEAAHRLGVSVATVRRWCKLGTVKATKSGKQWLIDAARLNEAPRPAIRKSRDAATNTPMDFARALIHVRYQDLVEEWVPDVLAYKDQFAFVDELLTEVSERFERGILGAASEIEIPKTPFFVRTGHLLSLHDRIAYHAVVASFAHLVEKALDQAVFSTRLAPSMSRRLLRRGNKQWSSWVRHVKSEVESGNPWLIKTDLSAYFDCIRHETLLEELGTIGVPEEIIDRLELMLASWATVPGQGIIQGPDVSRILGNYYLAPVDAVMVGEGYKYSRYMDDVRIVGETKVEVACAMRVFERECKRRGLIVSEAKTTRLYGDKAALADLDEARSRASYLFDSRQYKRARRELRELLKNALVDDGKIHVRSTRFSLWRLSLLRDEVVRKMVLDRLDDLGPVASVVGDYLSSFISRRNTEEALTRYINDPLCVRDPYLMVFLLAAMLEHPGQLPSAWITYARTVTKDYNNPRYFRGIASNVLALGRLSVDVVWIRGEIRREHDEYLLRCYVTALARVRSLDSTSASIVASRSRYLARMIEYLKAVHRLPSLLRPRSYVKI